MHFLEYERTSWLYCLLTTLQGTEAYLPHSACHALVSKETHGKDEFLQSVQVLFPQFHLFGTLTLMMTARINVGMIESINEEMTHNTVRAKMSLKNINRPEKSNSNHVNN